MSLTGHVKSPKSPVGAFFREIFPAKNYRSLLSCVHERLNVDDLIDDLERGVPNWVRGLVGLALDFRIRNHFSYTPIEQLSMPYEGIWGIARLEDLIKYMRENPSKFPDYEITEYGDCPQDDEDWELCVDTDDYTAWRKFRFEYFSTSQ